MSNTYERLNKYIDGFGLNEGVQQNREYLKETKLPMSRKAGGKDAETIREIRDLVYKVLENKKFGTLKVPLKNDYTQFKNNIVGSIDILDKWLADKFKGYDL